MGNDLTEPSTAVKGQPLFGRVADLSKVLAPVSQEVWVQIPPLPIRHLSMSEPVVAILKLPIKGVYFCCNDVQVIIFYGNAALLGHFKTFEH